MKKLLRFKFFENIFDKIFVEIAETEGDTHLRGNRCRFVR